MAILKLHLHNWLVENKQTLILAWTIAAFLFFFLHSKGRLSTLAVVVLVTLCRMKGSPGKRRRKKITFLFFFFFPVFSLYPPPPSIPPWCVYRTACTAWLPPPFSRSFICRCSRSRSVQSVANCSVVCIPPTVDSPSHLLSEFSILCARRHSQSS